MTGTTMKAIACAAFALFVFAPGGEVRAAEGTVYETWSNLKPLRQRLAPGALVRLPNGRSSRIVLRLPDGSFRTQDGVIITPEGVAEGFSGQAVSIAEDAPESAVTVTRPDGTVALADPGAVGPEGTITVPDDAVSSPEIVPGNMPDATAPDLRAEVTPDVVVPDVAVPDAAVPDVAAPEVAVPDGKAAPYVAVPVPPGAEETPVSPSAAIPPAQDGAVKTPAELTLAQMLPLTDIRDGKKAQPKAKEPEPAREQPKAAEKPKKEPAKEEPKAKEKPAEKPQEKPKKETPPAAKKPKVGEELSIPPEAAKTGNLSFLEGCWQGTRPEYYSKRIIKECFCFDANGKSGKRRILDSLGGRNCIGAAKANISTSSVLSISSEGAACDDGERWGQAEMVCKGSGAHTPCSWVFKDAQGGTQAYEISFVRVQKCGGK